MGGWMLEAFRMSCYIMFPVGVFYYVNKPEFFEQLFEERQRELYPKKTLKWGEMMEQAKEEVQEAKMKQLEQMMQREGKKPTDFFQKYAK